jgi:beta-N-acetylhexosaminidase
MTAHIVVPAFGQLPATVNPRVLDGLLRGDLGFDGLVVTDALEMRGLADSVGVEEGAVLALAAGADALCLGHDLHDDAVESVSRAIVAAVEAGRLPAERLEEAAARIARVAEWAQPRIVDVDSGLGLAAARRAIRVEGDARLDAPALVIELLPDPNIAAGVAEHSLTELLGGSEPGGRPVVVLRDAHRYQWARAETERILAERRDAIVVETGLPLWRPPSARTYVATHGAGRANLAAAAEHLRG